MNPLARFRLNGEPHFNGRNQLPTFLLQSPQAYYCIPRNAKSVDHTTTL